MRSSVVCRYAIVAPDMIAKYRVIFTSLPLVFSLSACGLLPNSTQTLKSAITLPAQFTTQQQQAKHLANLDSQWWLAIDDPQLSRLVNLAAKSNFDVRTAVERVNQARAGISNVRAEVMPSVNLMGSLADNRSGLPEYIKTAGNPDVKSRRMWLGLDWNFDLFGGNAAAKYAARSDFEAAAWGVKGAQLVAISETARQYFIYQSLLEKRRLVQAIVDTQQASLKMTQHKKQEGLASDFDLSLINTEVLNAQSLLPAINTGLVATQNQIALLTATEPSQMHITANIAVLNAPFLLQAIPTGQPADLLLRRPDVRAAELQLQAESARLKEAKSNRFPKLFLNAVYGQQKLTLNSLALAPSFYANTALAFAMPLLDSGRIKANIINEKAKESQALINYDKTIVSVLGQVENALSARNDEQRKLTMLNGIVSERARSQHHAQSLFKEGQFSTLQVLDIDRAKFAAEMAVLDSRLQNAINMVNVYAALGGGWESFDILSTGESTLKKSKPVISQATQALSASTSSATQQSQTK